MRVLFLAVALTFTGFAFAQDGALEINQACVADGCYSGDNPGFPVNIVSSGVYRLTSNLEVAGDQYGIFVDADSGPIEIDLNGFAVIGPNECSGEPVTECTATNQQRGIVARAGVKVRNGSVSGFETGVVCAGCHLSNMHISNNSKFGATAAIGANTVGLIARNCVFERNLYNGVRLYGEGNLVEGSVARFNGGAGIAAGDTGVIRNNAVSNNAEGGSFGSMSFGANVLVTGNSFGRAFSGGVTANNNSCDGVAC